jgi:methylisocitrate lyase
MSSLGLPDLGLISLQEMIHSVTRIVRSVNVPVLADMDNGFGNARNTVRMVKEAAYSGAAGILIEDQVLPKRCGHLDDKPVVEREEYLSKVAAACSERPDPQLVVVARIDSLATRGIQDAIERGLMAVDVGADAVFIEAPETLQQIEHIADTLSSKIPLIYNMASGGKSPDLSAAELGELGYRAMLISTVCLMPSVDAMQKAAADLFTTGSDRKAVETGLTPRNLFEILAIDEWEAVESRYSS